MSQFLFAKRENNSKRDFFVINTKQGRHFPSSVTTISQEFSGLGNLIKNKHPDDKCCVIAFAEAAVNLGAYIANMLGEHCVFLPTTRENIPGGYEILYFNEEHSHAVEHKICFRPEIFDNIDRVVLVDDEFTTGKTAVNLINVLFHKLQRKIPVTAASLFADASSTDAFEQNGIELITKHIGGNEEKTFPDTFIPDIAITPRSPDLFLKTNMVTNNKTGVNATDYMQKCISQCKNIADILYKWLPNIPTVEIIGTEEFSLHPVILGEIMEKHGTKAWVHSLTRSPMLAARSRDYPIYSRAKIPSPYDNTRHDYLYNRLPCDLTIILTDATCPQDDVIKTICGAVIGNKTAVFVF